MKGLPVEQTTSCHLLNTRTQRKGKPGPAMETWELEMEPFRMVTEAKQLTNCIGGSCAAVSRLRQHQLRTPPCNA